MSDGQGIGPAIGGLLGLGVMAYAAKGLIDTVKDKSKNDRKPELYREPTPYTPRIESDDRIQRGLDKMLGRR